ncbi:hypothetical protein [Streptomyces sp. NPDC088180]|uniref:hypothetical protein n=1 Tax=Streptomyces sp. NPDC088180 TaxID=3365837 RepID=UPI0037F3C84C
MSGERASADTPYLVLLGIGGLWGAASSGSPTCLRVLGGAVGALCLVLLIVRFVQRRRKRAAAEGAGGED